MTELSELLQSGLDERGRKRGGGPMPLKTAFDQYAPRNEAGKFIASREILRRVLKDGHTNIGDEAADAIAAIAGCPIESVLVAAGKKPRLGAFKLPKRAERLTREQRRVVLSVVNAILDAAESQDDEATVIEVGESTRSDQQ